MSGVLDHPVSPRLELETEARGRDRYLSSGSPTRRADGRGQPVDGAGRRIINVFGDAIPRLYATGELESSFGHLYLSGVSVVECFVTGRIAGCNVAAARPRR